MQGASRSPTISRNCYSFDFWFIVLYLNHLYLNHEGIIGNCKTKKSSGEKATLIFLDPLNQAISSQFSLAEVGDHASLIGMLAGFAVIHGVLVEDVERGRLLLFVLLFVGLVVGVLGKDLADIESVGGLGLCDPVSGPFWFFSVVTGVSIDGSN